MADSVYPVQKVKKRIGQLPDAQTGQLPGGVPPQVILKFWLAKATD
jgi:hypothetical protein